MQLLRVCSYLVTLAVCVTARANCPFDSEPDGDIDLGDYEIFSDCLSGPEFPIDPACQVADGNGDGFVDLRDFQDFQRFFTDDGPPALVLSPTMLVVSEVGGTQQLHAYTELKMFRCEVTDRTAIVFESSAPSAVSIDTDGLMTFHAEGAAQITVHADGLMAVANVEVDTAAMPLVQAAIGMAGGPIHLANGTGVDIPAGALPEVFMIQVEQVAALPPGTTLPLHGALAGPAYDFTPTDLSFDRDVKLTVAYDPAQIPAGYDEDTALVYFIASDGLLMVEPDPGPDVEDSESIFQEHIKESATVSVSTRHFSCRSIVVDLGLVETTLPAAPDGTTLRVFRHTPFPIKTKIAGQGPDGRWGRPFCDDNNKYGRDGAPGPNGPISDFFECFMAGPGPRGAGAACTTGSVDDTEINIPSRSENAIQYIVLHSTEGLSGNFKATITYATERCNQKWAHYYVGKDGTIVQLSPDTEITQHVCGNAALGINNSNSIGIEIDHPKPGISVSQRHYPGRQVSAIVRLCDYLLRRYPSITRPSAADPDGTIITHAAQDTQDCANRRGFRKKDPTNDFRTDVMGSPSIEEIIYRALRNDGHEGLINAKGGDAFGTDVPGDGGTVRIEAGVNALANNFDDNREHVRVAAGATVELSAPLDRMHILVEGTLRITTDITSGDPLDIDGVLYVGPGGVIDARGGFDGASGRSVHIDADGFALIEGRVFVNGTDKLGTTELAPFNEPPFPAAGSGDGMGRFGSDFVFRSAAPGPIWVPTIVTRGGDADSTPISLPTVNGGFGGNVEILAHNDAGSNAVTMHFEGKANDFDPMQHQNGLPDFLPPPAPFNQMPVISTTPIPSGTCVSSSSSTFSYVRPITSERLALGRFIDANNNRAVLQNVSAFNRGIITVGGIGGAQGSTGNDFAGFGGNGGNITVNNPTQGKIHFINNVQLFSGAGAGKLAYVISTTGCGGFQYFEVPTGGTGGKGALNGGDAGIGGDAGNITVTGIIHPALTAVPPLVTANIPIFGQNGGNPNSTPGVFIGTRLEFSEAGFSTSSTRGSGGCPGGHASSFPGNFGAMGANGTTTINDDVYFP